MQRNKCFLYVGWLFITKNSDYSVTVYYWHFVVLSITAKKSGFYVMTNSDRMARPSLLYMWVMVYEIKVTCQFGSTIWVCIYYFFSLLSLLPVKSTFFIAPSYKMHIVFFPRQQVIKFCFRVSRPLVTRCFIHILARILAIFAEDLHVLLSPTRQMMG
jgi:hypothetical protein